MSYFVPEDGENENSLNMFVIMKAPAKVTLADIRREFPMPGEYHFRFQYAYKSSDCKVWLDLCSEESTVPLFDNEIRVKVMRRSWHSGSTSHHPKQAGKQE